MLNKIINCLQDLWIAFRELFKKSRRPVADLTHFAFQRSYDELIAADSERLGLPVHCLKQGIGEMYARWHDYSGDYSS
jgi:hypothetical protein